MSNKPMPHWADFIEFNEDAQKCWLAGCKFQWDKKREGILQMIAPTRGAANWISSNLLHQIASTGRREFGGVKFVVIVWAGATENQISTACIDQGADDVINILRKNRDTYTKSDFFIWIEQAVKMASAWRKADMTEKAESWSQTARGRYQRAIDAGIIFNQSEQQQLAQTQVTA